MILEVVKYGHPVLRKKGAKIERITPAIKQLIADTDGKIADAYGVRMTGKNMARRVSFLIGLDGKIVHVTDNPSADVHLAEMQEAVAKVPKKQS